MKIGICLFGIIFEENNIYPIKKDIRHCWNNIKTMLLDPFKEQGHDINLYLSGYDIKNKEIEKEIFELVNPNNFYYSNIENSSSYTTKLASFNLFNDDSDFIILTRSDIHFSKKIAEENINFEKFNFLFKEFGNWENNKFTTDNFYAWPKRFTNDVYQSFKSTESSFYHTTHALYNFLIRNNITDNDINFISERHEFSDINSFFTLCKKYNASNKEEAKILREGHIHQEVLDRNFTE